MTIKEAQEAVDKWIKEYGVRYFNELTNMACLTEEVGELARVIARTYGDQSFKPGEKPNLGEEMADILWVLICLNFIIIILNFRKYLPTRPVRAKAFKYQATYKAFALTGRLADCCCTQGDALGLELLPFQGV